MAQAQGRAVVSRMNQAPDADNIRQPTLTAEQSVIRRGDAVYIQETTANGNVAETRVDSQQDADLLAKGQEPWWMQYVQDEVVKETTEVITSLDPREREQTPEEKKVATAAKSAATKAANKAAAEGNK